METLLRVIGMGLVVLAGMLVLSGLSDDAPGLIPFGLLVAGLGAFALVGARDEEARRIHLEGLLERLSVALEREDRRG